MSETKPARPLPVTVAGWLIVGGSVVVVLTAFETVAGLHSLDTREAVAEYLAEPPGDSLGIGVQSALTAIRVLATVAAVFAAVTAVLGYQVLRRSRPARVALSALAFPLFVVGFVSGGVASAVVFAAVVMLWFEPARSWMDGRSPAAAAAPAAVAERPPEGPPTVTPPHVPVRPVGGAPASPRPPALVWACALTWAFTAMAFVALLMSLVFVVAAPDLVFDELHRQNPGLAQQGFDEAAIRLTIWLTAIVVMVWSLVAAVLAALAWRRLGWARIALVVSAGLTGAVCLVGAITSPVLAAPLVAAAATATLLLRRDVGQWYRRRDPSTW